MATKQKTSTKTTSNQSNLIAISVVVGIVLFGLGYVVGKTKAMIRADALYDTRMNNIRQELMGDQEYRGMFMDKMMGDDDYRDDLFKRVDDYRNNAKRQMMYR